MLGILRSNEDAREAGPEYISLYGYLDGALFASSLSGLTGTSRPVKDKNGRGK